MGIRLLMIPKKQVVFVSHVRQIIAMDEERVQLSLEIIKCVDAMEIIMEINAKSMEKW